MKKKRFFYLERLPYGLGDELGLDQKTSFRRKKSKSGIIKAVAVQNKCFSDNISANVGLGTGIESCLFQDTFVDGLRYQPLRSHPMILLSIDLKNKKYPPPRFQRHGRSSSELFLSLCPPRPPNNVVLTVEST